MGPFKQGRIDPFVGRLDTYIGNLGGVRLLINTGGPVCRPYGRDVVNPGGAPSRGPGQLLLILRINSPSRALRRCAPLTSLRFYLPSALRRILGEKRRAHNVRPYRRGGGNLPPHPSGLRPATFPPGGRLGKNKKGQVWDLPLETKRRSGASQKISLLTFFFKESKRPRFTTGASYLCVL